MTRLWVPLLVAVLVGVLWWLASSGSQVPLPDASLGETDSDQPEAELVGRGTLVLPASSAEPEAAAGRATSNEPGESPHRLRGDLLGIETGDAALARVEVVLLQDGWPIPDRPVGVTGHVDASGHFDFDLGPLFDGLDFAPSHVEVVVDHTRHAQARQRIDLGFRDLDEPQTFSVTIRLRRAAVAQGVVTDRRGEPVPDASVGLFPMDGDSPRLESVLPLQPVATARTDGAGRYRLRAGVDGPHVLVAGKAGWVPRSVQLTLKVPEEMAVEALVLDAGVTIEGTLTSFGAPPKRGWVSAVPTGDPDGRGFPMQIGEVNVSWGSEGAVRQGQVRAQTDSEGHYRLVGLPIGGCWVSVGAELGGFDAITPPATQALAREVQAPAVDVAFDIVGVRLTVRVTADEPLAEDGLVMLSDNNSSASAALRDDWTVHALLAPEHEYQIRVDVPGFESRTQSFRSPASGEPSLTIELERAAPRPTLVVELRDVSGAPVSGASFRIHRPDAPDKGADWHWPDGVDGVFRIEQLEAGRIVVTVMPWRTDWNESGYGIDVRRELTLPAVGEHRLVLTARKGGRLRIAARDEAGALLPATCVIRNEDGDEQVVNFATHSQNMSMSAPGALGQLSPSLVDPPLRPGTYAIELRHEDAAKTLTAVVKGGQTTEVDVFLAD